MISIKEIDQKEVELCFELDSNTISLWTKKQWECEMKKEGLKAIAILKSNKIIGICLAQIILDEAQINYFSINQEFRRKGYGSFLMSYLIKQCEILTLDRLLLEVSGVNFIANKFYNKFKFLTVGIRRNYYRDGSDAILKEKKLIK